MDVFFTSRLTLPHTVNISVLKNNTTKKSFFYFYSSMFSYCIDMPTLSRYIEVDTASNSIIFFEVNPNIYCNAFKHLFSTFLFSWDYYFFDKIKFAGKGYRVTYRRRKKMIKFYFGYSHPTIMFFRNVKIKKPHKYKFVLLKNSFNKIKILSIAVSNIKPINIYTKRGIRKSRQTVYKRKSNKANF